MDKHDKQFGIALLVSLALSALIVVGAEGVVEHRADAPAEKSAA